MIVVGLMVLKLVLLLRRRGRARNVLHYFVSAQSSKVATLHRREGIHREPCFSPALAEQRQTPAALFTLSLNVLLAHGPPQEVVVGHALPRARHLRRASERDGIEVTKDLERHFAREELDGVEAHLESERFLQKRKLRRTCDREEAAEDEEATFRGRGREERPDRVDGLLLIRCEVLDRLIPMKRVT